MTICSRYVRYDDTSILHGRNETYYVIEAKLIRLLAYFLNFTFTIVYPKDGEFGRLSEDGKWTGLIGMVHREECDLAIDALGITEERRKAVNFSYSYYSADVTFLTHMPEAMPKNLAIFFPFSPEVWMASMVAFFLVSLVFYAFYPVSYQYISIVLFSFLMNQSSNLRVKFKSTRLLLLSWLIACLILTAGYKAKYLSFISFPPTKGVRNTVDLSKAVTKGTHFCMTYPGSFFPDALIKSPDDKMKIVGEDLKRNALVSIEPYEFLSGLQHQKGAFIWIRSYLSPLREKYFLSPDAFFSEMFAIATSKTFCCKEALNKIIRRITETGFYDRILRQKFTHDSYKFAYLSMDTERNHRLSMGDCTGILLCLFTGYAISLIVLMIEIILHRFH